MSPKVSEALPEADSRYAHEGESPGDLEAIRHAVAEWRARTSLAAGAHASPRKARFSTWGDLEVPDLLTPADVRIDYLRDLGMPGRTRELVGDVAVPLEAEPR